LEVRAWSRGISLRCGVLVEPPDLPAAAVLDPPEATRSYSTVKNNDAIGHGLHAQSTLDSASGWMAGEEAAAGEWMQVNLGSVFHTRGVVIRSTSLGGYATQVRVELSADGTTFAAPAPYNGTYRTQLTGNVAEQKELRWAITEARYVRVHVDEWVGAPAMRLGVLVSDRDLPRTLQLDPPEHSRTYSSVKNDDRIGTGNAQSRLVSAAGWGAAKDDTTQFVTVDVGGVEEIRGVLIKSYFAGGRMYAEPREVKLIVSESESGAFTPVADGVFRMDSLKSANSEEVHLIAGGLKSVQARYVRIVVTHWNGHVGLRCGVMINIRAKEGASVPPDCAYHVMPNIMNPRVLNYVPTCDVASIFRQALHRGAPANQTIQPRRFQLHQGWFQPAVGSRSEQGRAVRVDSIRTRVEITYERLKL
jgi:hypothetical protein